MGLALYLKDLISILELLKILKEWVSMGCCVYVVVVDIGNDAGNGHRFAFGWNEELNGINAVVVVISVEWGCWSWTLYGAVYRYIHFKQVLVIWLIV